MKRGEEGGESVFGRAGVVLECVFVRTTKKAAEGSGTKGTAAEGGGLETERVLEGEGDSSVTLYHQMCLLECNFVSESESGVECCSVAAV